MRVVYELRSGAMTYGLELEQVGATVTTRELRYTTGEPRAGLKPTKKRFASEADAGKYLRLSVTTILPRGYALVEGTAPVLDPAEDFRKVKDKTRAYRYFEHRDHGNFVDVDLDASNMVIVEGKIGEAGVETIIEHDWDGDAKTAYKAKLAELARDGYVLVEEPTPKAKRKR